MNSTKIDTRDALRRTASQLAAATFVIALSTTAVRAAPPEIRTTSTNRVPACVTPDRLMAFIKTRNSNLLPKFEGIAAYYKKHGETYRIRWDFAFYQMILETNYLMYKRGDGKQGDVSPKQNNFAGIGATGGGVPGDVYPDVSTGVLAQMQHLVAYSGEKIDYPIAPRTRLTQDGIVAQSKRLGRPVKFGDLRNRWAADNNYSRSIESVAERFNTEFCKGGENAVAPPEATAPPPRQADRPRRRAEAPDAARLAASAVPIVTEVDAPKPAEPPQPALRPSVVEPAGRMSLGVQPAILASPTPQRCRIFRASYGGRSTVLVRAEDGEETQFTVLTVIEGFEKSMTDSFLKSNAPGGTIIGTFPTREAAVGKVQEICPGAN